MHIDRDSDAARLRVSVVRGNFHKPALKLEPSAAEPVYPLPWTAKLRLGCRDRSDRGQPSWRWNRSGCRSRCRWNLRRRCGQRSRCWNNGWDGRGRWGWSKRRRLLRGWLRHWCLRRRGCRVATGQTGRDSESHDTDEETVLQLHTFSVRSPEAGCQSTIAG